MAQRPIHSLVVSVERELLLACVIAGIALTTACAAGPDVARPEAFPRSRDAREGLSSRPAFTDALGPPAPAIVSTPAGAPRAAAVLQTAVDLLGTKYRYGGQAPDTGFDCSGFVGYVFRQHSIDMPRTVAEQFLVGRAVAQDDVQAGDLVFFTTTGPGATHVGIVFSTGNHWEFIHAPADGSSVRIERFDTGYWAQRWIGAKRVLTGIVPFVQG